MHITFYDDSLGENNVFFSVSVVKHHEEGNVIFHELPRDEPWNQIKPINLSGKSTLDVWLRNYGSSFETTLKVVASCKITK